ncbi:hypothetical protein H3H36_10880 [Duganella sp. FT3S]|uniref:Uncharacterized protein n=1 Tax=Rugamonas fusca TaxID=2758568 RepID=A0A7W2EH81_9BURK|nr:hypothetical protein [Rugamonas fusca]MBA5605863.1 hypothetical protein [Rugamonas fusca]
MSEKLDEFMLVTDDRLEQLEGQIEAQKMVIAWLLSQLDLTHHFPSDAIPKFLSRQANELDGDPKYVPCVASIDELRGLFASLALVRDKRG